MLPTNAFYNGFHFEERYDGCFYLMDKSWNVLKQWTWGYVPSLAELTETCREIMESKT
jgi:hypothetical protein